MLKHRIMLVDDHPLFRAGLRHLLEQDEGMRVVAEAANGHHALQLANRHHPALVLMDDRLPGLTGLQTAAALRRLCPQTHVIILSTYASEERLLAALRADVAEYLTKDLDPTEVVAAVHAVLRGEKLLQRTLVSNPSLMGRLMRELRSSSDDTRSLPPLLSPREVQVLDCVTLGYSNREIGVALATTEQTIKNRMTSVLRKLAVADRLAVVRFAVAKGWVEYDPRPFAAVERVDARPLIDASMR